MHPAGQGVWVARMAAEMESHPILCGFIGGETGTVLRPLMDQLDAELRLVHTDAAAGCYVDRPPQRRARHGRDRVERSAVAPRDRRPVLGHVGGGARE